MRRHFLCAENETERSVGKGKENLLQLWHNRRNAMLNGDNLIHGGEENASVTRELMQLWDVAKPIFCIALNREQYVEFFARVAKALVLSLKSDALAIAVSQRDWEYDLEGGTGVYESDKNSQSVDNRVLIYEQFCEAVMQIAEIILPVESSAGVFAMFLIELRHSIAETILPTFDLKPEQDENNSSKIVDRFTLRPFNQVLRVSSDLFSKKSLLLNDSMQKIEGLPPPNEREMSLKELLVCYNPRKFSLTRAFGGMNAAIDTEETFASTAELIQTSRADKYVDDMEVARQVHLELVGKIGIGATPAWSQKLHREKKTVWNYEDAVIDTLIDFPALKVAVVGPPGCGKTRLARILAQRLGLRYLSQDEVVQQAFHRRCRLRWQEDTADIPAKREETRSLTQETTEGRAEIIDVNNETDRVFRDEDFNALCKGQTVPRSSSLALLRIEFKLSILAGVGVVLDDVYPSELAAVDEYDSTFTADYLVALTASPSEVEYQLHTSELAPISGRLYSARELAVLRATSSDVLLTQSFADSHGLPEKLKVGAGEIDSLIARDNKGNKVDVLTEENDQSVNFDSPQQTVLPPDLNFEIGNDIELSNEHTLPFGTLKMVKVGLGYHKYLKRIQRELSIRRAETTKSIGSICHLVVILANQSFGVIQHHSIQAITGSLLGLSRFSTSREACSVALPEEIKRSSRNEQVKWLLYGDWNPLIAAEAANSFARLPRRDAHRRLLSKWREFCPVLSTLTNKLSHGEPEFAACYSGRVYLLSSQDARRDFCACPLQYLSQNVPVPSTVRNMWLITTENVKSSYTEKLGAGLHAQTVSPLNLLEISSAPMDTRLTCGQIVPSIEAAAVAAKAVKTLVAASNTSNRWMLTDLPLTRDIATILLEHDVVPDVILTLDKDMAIAQEDDVGRNTQPNEGLVVPRRHQIQTDMASTDEILQVFDFKPISITCPLFRKPSDTLVAIDRELNPLAPRLDRIKDGHMPELVDGYDPATIFASPVSESDDDKNIENASEVETLQLQIKAYAKTVTLQLQGECGRFCPVSWKTRNLLIPGLPSTICCFRQKFYTFAGDTERRAFERNPSAFILDEPFSTSKFIPWVLLLGVRGSGHNRIAAALDQSLSQRGCSSVDYINVDMTALVESAERYQQLEELKPEEARQTREINFVRSLKLELQRHMPTHDNLIVNVTAGLGPEDSRIPNPTVLEECFKHGLFPALVIPLIVSEERNERTLLTQWVANYRQDVAFTRKDGIGVNTSQFLNDSINLDDAREEESSRLHDRFTNDQEALDEAITKLRARGIRVCDPVDATQTMRQMVKQVKTIVNEFMAGQEALFERCQVVDMPMGDEVLKMLASGELLIGKHDLACPVTGRTDPSSPLPSKAVVYRDQLYFPRSREAYSAFLACPVKYVRKTSHSPKHQSTCCVVGTPFSDTTRVARELAKTLKTIYVSPENAIDWVIQCQCGSKLWSQILEIKEQQCDPLYSPDIIHEAICTRLHSSECQTCGWVLDGYQLNPHELQRSLPTSSDIDAVSQSIKADVLFVLERSFASVWNECHTKVDQSTLQEASAQWYTFRLELIDVWTRRFTGFHVRQLDTTNSSLWHVVTQAQEFLKRQQQLASEHAAALACNRAARSIGVVRTHQELQARQHSVYQTFCPVELRVGRYVNSCQSNRDLCVDFQNFTYWLGSTQNLEQFVACPEAYIGCLSDQRLDEGDTLRSTRKEVEKVAQALVAEAPVSASFISLLTVPDWIFPELKGYCPVTFRSRVDAKDWSALHHGSIFYRASYRSKVYFFVSQEARHQFCVEPSRFISQSLPVKLPPQVTLAKNYPGRLEQELGATLNEVLLALGSERPKFPQMSVRASACVYLALSLKALYQQKRDPNSYASQNEEEYDEEYQQRQARRAEQHRRKALAKRDAFVNDCRLGEKLKAASTPSHRSCGSGSMGARTVRAAQDALNDNHLSGSFDCEDVELLRHRFDAIVDGRAGEEDKALSADPHTVRMHAREAFFEYTKASAAD